MVKNYTTGKIMATPQNIIRIKCPKCGAVLTLKSSGELSGKKIKCAICSTISQFEEFKVVNSVAAPADSDATSLPNNMQEKANATKKLGSIRHQDNLYTLSLGANIIGRKALSSTATVQIDTDDRTMSRCHITIEVVATKAGEHIYYLYTAKNMNGTKINGNKIGEGDKIILTGSETIEMGLTKVTFVNEI